MSAPSRVLAALVLSACLTVPAGSAIAQDNATPNPAPVQEGAATPVTPTPPAPTTPAAAAPSTAASVAPSTAPAEPTGSPSATAPAATSTPAASPTATDPVNRRNIPTTVELRARSGSIAPPSVSADAWVVADLDTGEVLAQHNPTMAVRPASTLKLLTAATVLPRLALEQPYRAVLADEVAEGNRVVMYQGLTYTVADLLHAAMLPSANDAANALARANGGIEVTVAQMNEEAKRLGATKTTVMTPSGLDEVGQSTTALDMALVGRAAFSNPEIASVLLLKQADFPGKQPKKGKRVVYPIYNHDRTLWHTGFAGTMGGKSGFTSKAGNTLVTAADRDGHRLIATLFHIGGNTYRAGETLLDWAYANRANLQPVAQLPKSTAPAPTFDRTVQPLPEIGAAPTTRKASGRAAREADAPTATAGASRILPDLPSLPGLPAPLTLMTLAVAGLVLVRARVYWAEHRDRTAWIDLDTWAAEQVRSSRRTAPADPVIHSEGQPGDLAGEPGPAPAASGTNDDLMPASS